MATAVLHVPFLFGESHFEDRLIAVGHGRLAFFLEHRQVRQVHGFLPDDQHIMSGGLVSGVLLRGAGRPSFPSPEKSKGNGHGCCGDSKQESLSYFHRAPPISGSRPTKGVKPVLMATSKRLWASLSRST